jgi:uncharacterized repeat protein (TIGR01451 family)
MNQVKEKMEDIITSNSILIPKMDSGTKRQIHSLITLAMSVMLFLVPFTTDVAATGSVYNVSKNATAVNGIPGGNVTAAGDIISYQINVNNTDEGNLTNVTVTDLMLGGILNVTDLGMGSNETLYRNYTVTQADIDNNGNGTGFIINNVTVVCDQNAIPNNATAIVPIANCTIVKTVTGVTGDGNGNVTAAGDVISYQIDVDNGGRVDLTNVTVTDPMLGGLLNVTDLGIGSNETLYGNYTVTQADIDNNGNGTGFIINNATVDCDQLGSKNATVATPITSCTIVKTITDVIGEGNGNVTAAGDIISYEINVNNTAGMDLTNVTVTDPMLGGLLLNISSLGMGSNETVYGNYTVTQEDINNNGNGIGFIINNATIDCDQLGPKNATVTVPIERNPNYSIFKSVISPDPTGDCIINRAGDEVPYQIVVKNEGNVDLTGISVNDPMISLPEPTGDDYDPGVLNPGETWTYDAIYTLTPEDVDNGHIDNTATVSSDELPDKSSSVDTPVDQNADLSIYKSVTGIDEAGDHMIDSPGDIINYQIAVKNNGDVTLHNVHVTDSLIGDLSGPTGDSVDPGVLNPGKTWIYKGDYTVTQTDIDNNGDGSGFIANTATVSCNEHSSESSSIQLPIITYVNTQTNTNNVPDNTSGNGSESQPATTNVQPATISSSGGSGEGSSGGSGGSIGSANVVGSTSSTVNTSTTDNVTQSETNTSNIEQSSTPANVEQTPEQTQSPNTSTTGVKKSPGFESFIGIVGLLAVFLYKRRPER